MMRTMKKALGRSPVVRVIYRKWLGSLFPGSQDYWEARYAARGTSGAGSYGVLAHFKADVINEFVHGNGVQSVIEFGCGDGNQLTLFDVPRYIGLDVSKTCLRACVEKFRGDRGKSFFLYDPAAYWDGAGLLRTDLALSLDVVYHLVEDAVYDLYMHHLFSSATKYVIIYSSNYEQRSDSPHVRHRVITDWVEGHRKDWALLQCIPNRHPYDPQRPTDTSFADFYIYGPRETDAEAR